MTALVIIAAIALVLTWAASRDRHPCPHPHVEQVDDWAWVCTSCDEVLEEVAKEVDNFKAFEKDTMGSFAAYVRSLKR